MDKINQYKKNAMIITFIILAIGVFMVYDASYIWSEFKYGDRFYYLKRQMIFALIGIILFFIGKKISLSFLKKHINLLLLISFLMLGMVLIPHVGLIRGGSSSWLGVGPISIQPSELFKISLILYFAKFLSTHYKDTMKIKSFILPIFLCIFGIFLIMLQPDFGTSMVILSAIIIMMFTSRLKVRYFVIAFFILLLFIGILIILAPYRAERITSFIDPFKDPLGSGFQMIQSLFSVSPGGFIGLGIDQSIQKYFYLPEPQTDFIFAIIVEEFGLLGGTIILVLYALLFYECFQIIRYSKDEFNAYFSLGILSLFLVQVLINLGVVVSILPVTGITLPLISYGGSSLCVLLFSLGLMLHKENS